MALASLGIHLLPIPAPPNSSHNSLPFTSRRALVFAPSALMASLLAFPLPTHAALPQLQDQVPQEEDRVVALFQVPLFLTHHNCRILQFQLKFNLASLFSVLLCWVPIPNVGCFTFCRLH